MSKPVIVIPKYPFSSKFDIPTPDELNKFQRSLPLTLANKKVLLKWFLETGIHKCFCSPEDDKSRLVSIYLETYKQTGDFLSRHLKIPRNFICAWGDGTDDELFDEQMVFRLSILINDGAASNLIWMQYDFYTKGRCKILDSSMGVDESGLIELYQVLKLEKFETGSDSEIQWDAAILNFIELLNLIKEKLS